MFPVSAVVFVFVFVNFSARGQTPAVVFLTSVPVPKYLLPGLGRGVWARLFMLCVLHCLRLVVAPFALSGSTLSFSRWSALVAGASLLLVGSTRVGSETGRFIECLQCLGSLGASDVA